MNEVVVEVSEDSDGNSKVGIKAAKGKIKIPELPTRFHEIPTFHMDLSDAIMAQSMRQDNKER